MDIVVSKKQNSINIAGNIFQASSTPVVTATYSTDYVDVYDEVRSVYIVKDAHYSIFKDDTGAAISNRADEVASYINSYASDENPDRVIVKPTTINDGDLMYWKADPGNWYPSSRSNLLGDQSISNLSDVYLSNPQNGQTLVYNYTNSQFENAEPGASSTDYSVNEMLMIFLEK